MATKTEIETPNGQPANMKGKHMLKIRACYVNTCLFCCLIKIDSDSQWSFQGM